MIIQCPLQVVRHPWSRICLYHCAKFNQSLNKVTKKAKLNLLCLKHGQFWPPGRAGIPSLNPSLNAHQLYEHCIKGTALWYRIVSFLPNLHVFHQHPVSRLTLFLSFTTIVYRAGKIDSSPSHCECLML